MHKMLKFAKEHAPLLDGQLPYHAQRTHVQTHFSAMVTVTMLDGEWEPQDQVKTASETLYCKDIRDSRINVEVIVTC
jgi:hypothetical protein